MAKKLLVPGSCWIRRQPKPRKNEPPAPVQHARVTRVVPRKYVEFVLITADGQAGSIPLTLAQAAFKKLYKKP